MSDERCEAKRDGVQCARLPGHAGLHNNPIMGERWRDGEDAPATTEKEPTVPLSEHQRVQAEHADLHRHAAAVRHAALEVLAEARAHGQVRHVTATKLEDALAEGTGSGWLSPEEAEKLRAELTLAREIAKSNEQEAFAAHRALAEAAIERDTLWSALSALRESATEQQEALGKALRGAR